MGQTYYDLIASALVNDNWKASIDSNVAYGINKIRLNVYDQGYYISDADSIYPDAQPYAGSSSSPDRDHLNLTQYNGSTYWQKLDEIVAYMDSKGVVADLIITNPYRSNRMFGTDTQNDRFINYVVSRYAAYDNVVWNLANEFDKGSTSGGDYPQEKSDFNRMGALVHNADPWQSQGAAVRPLSVHQGEYTFRGAFQWFGTPWVTHVSTQYGHYDYGVPRDATGQYGITENLGHDIPVIDDESAYIGAGSWTAADRRREIWGVYTAGGYFSNGDWRNPGTGIVAVTGDWLDEPTVYGDVKRLIDFFTAKGIEYWKMASQNSLVTSGTRTYCAGRTWTPVRRLCGRWRHFLFESSGRQLLRIPVQSTEWRYGTASRCRRWWEPLLQHA